MATVNVVLFHPAEYKGFGVIGEIRAQDTVTSSGTSGVVGVTSVAGEIARIAVSGGAVHIVKGTGTPIADTDDLLLSDGSVEYLYMNGSETIAVIDAA